MGSQPTEGNEKSLTSNLGFVQVSLENQTVTKDNIGTLNRPLLLIRQLQQSQHDKSEGGKATHSNVDHLFRIEFDPSTGIPPCWVDTKTLNFFNTLRDTIFASSSQYDKYMPSSGTDSNEQDKKKKRAEPNTTVVVDKQSVAFQRGKRSCTLTDLPLKESQKIINELRSSSQGKISAGPVKQPSKPSSLVQQAETLVKGDGKDSSYLEYDFCHHCKQLKSKSLLVQCKYSSKNFQRQHNTHYTPYPYEPQVSTVNNIKIFNADLQNKSQLRGLIEGIKKDLKLKNQALEAARVQMKNFMIPNDSGCGQIDIFAFQQHHPQLLTWI